MSKIKLFKIGYIFKSYLNLLLKKKNINSETPYIDHFNAIMEDLYGESNFWILNLEATGRYEVMEIFGNNDIIQLRWAKENQIKEEEPLKIIEAQIRQFKPDVIFTAGEFIPLNFYDHLRKSFPFIKSIVAWNGHISAHSFYSNYFDLVFTCVPDLAQKLNNGKTPIVVLPFGFDESILKKLKINERKFDISFVGSLFLHAHHGRTKLLYDLAKGLPEVEYWISNISIGMSPLIREWINELRFGRIRNFLHIRNMLRLAYLGNLSKGSAFGIEMFQILHDSKLTLNIHGDSVKNAGNIRLLEASGVGSCQITDWKPNIQQYFLPDEEVVCYRSSEEAIEKIKYLLNKPVESKKIALNGQKRILRDFSFKRRVEIFDFELQKVL